MKNIYIFLAFSIYNLSLSQDARIFQNTWYLTNIIENGINNYPTTTDVNLNLYTSTYLNAYSGCHVSILANVIFENNNTNFSASNISPTLNYWCTDQILYNYGWKYYIFFSENDSFATRYFTYTITETPAEKNLIINSAFNKQAIYSNIHLANKGFEKSEISLFPNPTTDFLEITINNESLDNATVLIYNELGAVCKSEVLNDDKTKIDTKNLSNGIYFVKIQKDNETITKKFVKI